MNTRTLFKLDTPYREPFEIVGYEFGDANAKTSIGIVGALRGNEIQQTFICARIVRRLKELEEKGCITNKVRILVIPSANSFSTNIGSRFWPLDNTDINRMFPGYDLGETTQRIADGIFSAINDFDYGIQLCSYYLPGEFTSHVRITNVGNDISKETLEVAKNMGLPYVLEKQPTPFDTTTLNYNWQVWDTKAVSLYSSATDRINATSARFAEECIVRFLVSIDAVDTYTDPGYASVYRLESDLVNVRTTRGGFLRRIAPLGMHVRKGDVLAEVLHTCDCSVLDRLVCPVDGTVFFEHDGSLVNEDTIAFKILPNIAKC